MALIKCTECGHEVSDRASECPNCGCPIQREDNPSIKEKNVEPQAEKKGNSKKWALLAISLCLVLGGGYYAYTKFFKSVSEKDAIVELTPEFIAAIEKYDQLGIFSEGYAAVRKGEKWGYINAKGEEVIPVNIDAYCVGRFSEGLAFVAHGMENANFSVIDTEGNVVFKRSGFNWDSEFPESHDMPYFIKGKIYVPTLDSKQDVYDKQGNKLETISWEEKDSIQKISVKSSNAVFVEETNGVGEVEDYVCREKYGIKDSVGKVLISAKYDEMAYDRDKDNEDRPLFSNGVILVVLEEPEEGHYTDGSKYDPSIRHYGYVDLKGNDTFSEELKARCLKAETKAMDNYKSYLASFEQQQLSDDEYSNGEYDQTSYNNERIVTISFRKERGGRIIGSHGVRVLYVRLLSNSITVPNGKVWIFKDYKYSQIANPAYGLIAGFFDDDAYRGIYYQLDQTEPSSMKGWWKRVQSMNGERLYGGREFYMYWNYPDNDEFYFEANFIERDE